MGTERGEKEGEVGIGNGMSVLTLVHAHKLKMERDWL